MMLKKYLNKNSFNDSICDIKSQIKELEENSYILHIHEFCKGISPLVSNENLKSQMLFKIFENNFGHIYWSFCEVKNNFCVESEIGSLLDDHYGKFFNKYDKTMWSFLNHGKTGCHLPSIQIDFLLDSDGVERFKKDLLGEHLYLKYFNAKVFLNLEDKTINKKPKI